MKKVTLCFLVDSETFDLIEEAAHQSRTSRSSVARQLLHMIRHVPPDTFKETSPLPEFFGITPGGKNGNRPNK
jgi:hypothetical protein